MTTTLYSTETRYVANPFILGRGLLADITNVGVFHTEELNQIPVPADFLSVPLVAPPDSRVDSGRTDVLSLIGVHEPKDLTLGVGQWQRWVLVETNRGEQMMFKRGLINVLQGNILNALLNPSAFGWPDATNTGTSGALTPMTGGVDITTDATVIENMDIDGDAAGYGLFVNADNVIIRNCRIHTVPTNGAGGCIRKADNALNLLIEDCELFYNAPFSIFHAASSVGDMNYTMRRCHVHDVGEGLRVGDNTTVEDCYIHALWISDPESHGDCLQSTGGSNILVKHNTIIADVNEESIDFGNAAVIIGAEFATSTNITLEDNLWDWGSHTLYTGPSLAFAMSNVITRRNRWGRNFVNGPHSIDSLGEGIAGYAWEAATNVFDDDNTQVPVPVVGP